MPAKRVRNAGVSDSEAQLSREMRRKKLALFIQQFEKEGLRVKMSLPSSSVMFVRHVTKMSPPSPRPLTAQERMNELEAKMESTLATIDEVFRVELMKLPLSLQNTRIGDLMRGEPLGRKRTVTDPFVGL